MDKQQEAAAAAASTTSDDSISIKTEYPPHDVYVSEAPPAYKLKTRPTAVQIARITAFTVIVCSFILGSFMLAVAWLQANASCSQLMHAETLFRQSEEAADRPQYQALVDPLQSDETSDSKQELPTHQQSTRNIESQTTENDQTAATPVQIKLPLELDFEEIIGALLEKNQRSRMNCVIEKKRAEEVMDHQPKTLRLPFGMNITTDPRFEHVTGERLSIVCESGHDEKRASSPAEQMQQQPSMMMPMPMGTNPITHLPNMMGPPPPPHHMPHQHQHHGPIPLAMIARINTDFDNHLQLQEQQQIEEHIIPIFQQLIPELRQTSDNHEHQNYHKQEAEDRSMPNKVLYHPAMSEGRPLYTVAISEKPNGDGTMMQHNIPSDTVRQNGPMFQRVPIHVPVSMMMPPGPGQSGPQETPIDDPKPNHPHFVHPRSVESAQEINQDDEMDSRK